MLHDRTSRSVLQILTDDSVARPVFTQITDLIHLFQPLFLVPGNIVVLSCYEIGKLFHTKTGLKNWRRLISNN